MKLEPVRRVLEHLGAPYALIGAHAMAARGYPRFTVDIDLLTTDSRVLDRGIWTDLERSGATIDARRGDLDDPLAGVVHIMLADETDIDLVVAKWSWEAAVIERASEVIVAPGVTIRVPQTSDLILLKLAAGGFLDLRDAAALLALGDRDRLVSQVEAHISDVRPDVRDVWSQVLAATP